MPTAALVKEVDDELEHIRALDVSLAPEERDDTYFRRTFYMLDVIESVCRDQTPFPAYWEGVVKVLVTKGFIAGDAHRMVAFASYSEALGLLIKYRFDESACEQESLIRRALWERFVHAKALKDHTEAAHAAWAALDGVRYAICVADRKSRRHPVKVTDARKRRAMWAYLYSKEPMATAQVLLSRRRATTTTNR